MRDLWIRRGTMLLLGGLLGAYIPAEWYILSFGFMALIGVRILLWRSDDFFARLFRPEIPLLTVSLFLGFIYGRIGVNSLPEPLVLDREEIVGCLKDWSISEERADGLVYIREGELEGQTYRLAVYPDSEGRLSGEWQRVQPGDLISFRGHLERPKSLGTPGGFDVQLYYGVRGISGSVYAQGDVVLISPGEPDLPWKIRRQVRHRLELWDSEETGIFEGILFGDSTRIPNEIKEYYQVTGVLHVFAASGSNVAFVLGFAWIFFWFLPKGFRIGGTILALFLYAALCGGNVPIIRATILGTALLLGRLGNGRVATLRWLFFAAVGLFIYNPLTIKDLGFQLSFTATWGMIVLTPEISKTKLLARLPSMLRLAVAGTLAAQCATLPLLIAAFHRLSIIGLIVNVFILFLLGSVLELGLIGVLLSFSGVMSAPFFQVSLWILEEINIVLKFLSELPYADVWVLNPGLLFWLIWYGWLGVVLWGKARTLFILKVRLRYCSGLLSTLAEGLKEGYPGKSVLMLQGKVGEICGRIILGNKRLLPWGGVVMIVLLMWSPWNLKRDLELVILDVGQGDATLVRTPDNEAVLIDAGPCTERFDAGKRIVLPYLLNQRIREIKALLITHEHEDHIGGVKGLLSTMPTAWVGVPDVGERLENEEWQNGFPFGLDEGSDRLRRLGAGDNIDLGSGAYIEVLGPRRILEGTHSDANNNSLVLMLHYRGYRVMLTGDMEEEEMQDIHDTGLDLDAQIFKVPHHGSRFSLYEPWLDSTYPQAVWISVGKNSFGHPSPEVLRYWEERHIPVFRTDEDGTIRFILGEHGVEVITGRT